MLVFLMFFIFIKYLCDALMPVNLAEFAMPFHQACLRRAPSGTFRDVYQATICGASMSAHPLAAPLSHAGIYFVVTAAGSHLMFIDWWLRWSFGKSRRGWWVLFSVASVFAIVSKGSLPAIRAVTQLVIGRCSAELRLSWSRVQIVTLSGLVTMTFCTSKHALNGLILSWIASLAIGGLSHANGKFKTDWWSHISLQGRIYVLMLPALLPMSAPNPLSIFGAALCYPGVAFFLFSFSLVAFVFPFLSSLIDFQWVLFAKFADLLASFTPTGFEPISISVPLIVIYLFILTVLAWRPEEK